MSDDELQALKKLCQDVNPAKLRLYRDDELLRDVPVPATRKKWLGSLSVVAKLPMSWTHIELCDRKDEVLEVYRPRNETPAATSTALTIGGIDLAQLGANSAADLARVIVTAVAAGQRDVLNATRDKESEALRSMVAMMDKVTAAVGTLANVHAATLEAQRQQAQVQIATAAQVAATTAAAQVAPAASEDEPESMEIFRQLAPHFGEKLAQGVIEKFGPMLMSMFASAAPAAKAPVIDIKDGAKKA